MNRKLFVTAFFLFCISLPNQCHGAKEFSGDSIPRREQPVAGISSICPEQPTDTGSIRQSSGTMSIRPNQPARNISIPPERGTSSIRRRKRPPVTASIPQQTGIGNISISIRPNLAVHHQGVNLQTAGDSIRPQQTISLSYDASPSKSIRSEHGQHERPSTSSSAQDDYGLSAQQIGSIRPGISSSGFDRIQPSSSSIRQSSGSTDFSPELEHKKSTKPIYWAVAKDKKEGIYKTRDIYKTWRECLENIDGYPDANMRTFDNEKDVQKFLDNPDDFENSLEETGKREYFYNDAIDRIIREEDGTIKEQLVARPTEAEMKNIQMKQPISAVVRAVYTDGSTSNDQRQTSIGVFWGDDDPRNIGELVKDAIPGTEELLAIIRAMEDGKNLNGLAIMTDCQYCIIVINKHLEKLKYDNNKWLNAQRKQIKHIELYRKIKMLRQSFLDRGFPVYFVKVDSRSGDYGNIQADRLSKRGRNAMAYYVVPYHGIYTDTYQARAHVIRVKDIKKFGNNLPSAIEYYKMTST